jgi:Acyl-CoA carboxylase epsilon subunit
MTPARAAVTVCRGHPDAAELAAVTAVLLALARRPAPAAVGTARPGCPALPGVRPAPWPPGAPAGTPAATASVPGVRPLKHVRR